MDKYSQTFHVVRCAVALAMGVAVVVLGILRVTNENTLSILLGIGLFILALDALNNK
jgi:hypothetical protein